MEWGPPPGFFKASPPQRKCKDNQSERNAMIHQESGIHPRGAVTRAGITPHPSLPGPFFRLFPRFPCGGREFLDRQTVDVVIRVRQRAFGSVDLGEVHAFVIACTVVEAPSFAVFGSAGVRVVVAAGRLWTKAAFRSEVVLVSVRW